MCGVARYYNFVQCQGIFLHHDFHAVLGRQFQGLKTNVSENQRLVGLHLDFEISVEVGHCAVRRFLLHDSYADDGFSRSIDYAAGDFAALRVHKINA